MDPALLGKMCEDLGVSEPERERNAWVMDTLNVSLSLGIIVHCPSVALSSGSSAEGLEPTVIGSDFDTMSIATNASVVQNAINLPDVDIVFQAIETKNPCFVLLKVLKAATWKIWDFSLPDIVKRIGDFVVLPSEQMSLIDLARSEGDRVFERHGPAMSVIARGVELDMIKALRCTRWPPASQIFLNYDGIYSDYHWPSLEERQRIVRMGCHVVPKGNTKSNFGEFEWSYSFSLAEKMLVRLFNTVQFQCYFLMKMLLNFLIKPKSGKALCSYHIKTMMLHIVAKANHDFWVPANLHNCLQICLDKLLEFISWDYCPNFFIPRSNLFDSDEFRENREGLLLVVRELCREGYICVLRCAPLLMDVRYGCGHHEIRCRCFVEDCLKARLMRYLNVYINGIMNVLMAYYDIANAVSREPDPFAAIIKLKEILRSVDENDAVAFPNRIQALFVKSMAKVNLGYLSLVFTLHTRHPCIPDVDVIKLCADGCRIDFSSGKLKLACFLYMRQRVDMCIQLVYSVLASYDSSIIPFTADKARYAANEDLARTRKVADKAKNIGCLERMLQEVACPVVFLNHELHFAPEEIGSILNSPALTQKDERMNGIVFIDSLVFALYLLVKCFHDNRNVRIGDLVLRKLRDVVRGPGEYGLYYGDSGRVLLENLQRHYG